MSAPEDLHRTLRRQLSRAGLTDEDLGDDRIADLLARVSSAYEDADKQRYLHDRAFLLASSEMQNLYDRLEAASQSEAAVQRDRLKAIFDTAATGLIVLEADGRVFDLNPVAESILNLDHDAMIGAALDAVLRPADPDDRAIADLREAIAHGEHWRTSDTLLRSRRGQAVSASMLFRAMPSGGGVLAVEDISERKQAQAELLWRANHDALTGLLNRPALIDRINRALQRARRYGTHLAVLFLDLDRFKRVNDTLGHAAGDALLVECGRRITSIMREVDSVARLGGDEFVAICENLAHEDDAYVISERVAAAIGEPFTVEGETAFVEASIGIAMSDGHGVDPDALLRDADVALYEAKQRSGAAVVLYTEAMIRRMQHALALERRLRQAMPTEDLWVAYQPIQDLSSGAVVGFESLARWTSFDGPIAPDEFIPAADSAGLLDDLGRRLIPEALRFQSALPADQLLFVNMAPGQIAAKGVIDWLEAQLRETGADPYRLFIEITETDAIADHAIAERLARLRSQGVRIALDDFGVGHSSLAALRDLPIDLIKMDRSFLAFPQDPRSVSVARTVVDLGRALEVAIVAEGVETQEHLDFLHSIACPMAQGYLLGAPQPEQFALDYLA